MSQNTEEYNTDKLTLLVNLDKDGNAVGVIYEDAGDGFDFRNGEYAEYKAEAKTVGKNVEVTLTRIGGKMDKKAKTLRIGIITTKGIKYSPWIDSDTVTVRI